jgi:hypothetical protein
LTWQKITGTKFYRRVWLHSRPFWKRLIPTHSKKL